MHPGLRFFVSEQIQRGPGSVGKGSVWRGTLFGTFQAMLEVEAVLSGSPVAHLAAGGRQGV